MSLPSYDSQDWLDAYKNEGRFPVIHDALYAFIMEQPGKHAKYLDIGGGTGLLGARIHRHITSDVWTLDRDRRALDRGCDAGVLQGLIHFDIRPDNLDALAAEIRVRGINTLVARWTIPDIMIFGPAFALDFGGAVRGAGIQAIYLEGKPRKSGSTHPIPNLDAEIASLAPAYRLKCKRGRCAMMRVHFE